RRHTRSKRDWSSDVCSSDLYESAAVRQAVVVSRLEWISMFGDPNKCIPNVPATWLEAADAEACGKVAVKRRIHTAAGSLWPARRSEERRVGKEGRWEEARYR